MSQEDREVQTVRLIQDRIARKQWRSETEKEVRRIWQSGGREVCARMISEVRRMYAEAGAGYSGRFQG